MLLKDKKSRLGRGLGSLIPDYTETNIADSDLQELPINRIVPNPNQPRVYFDEEKLKELSESIKAQGVNQPILVRKIAGDKYEIVAGERRWRACVFLNLETIPAIIRELGDDDAFQIALIENIQREDINPVEEARAYSQLIKRYGYTQEELSAKLGKSRPAIANTVRLLDLADEILDEIVQGDISAGHGRALLALPVNEHRIEALNKIMAAGLNVRQTEALVKQMLSVKAGEINADAAFVFDKKDLIKNKIWSKFNFVGNEKKGKFVFSFSTEAELHDLMLKLGLDIISK